MEDSVRDEYFRLLRFESVGADPAKLRDCAMCAGWWREWLQALGFAVELKVPEKGAAKFSPPVVIAERTVAEGAPTALIYGHYDVQPVDPVSEWKTPPFEPTVIGDRVHCRGAQDDKGQSFAFLCGMRDFLATPKAGSVNLKVVLDGQEESGSAALSELAPQLRRRLAADVLLVCDTSASPGLRPAVVAGMRGVAHLTVRLKGANRDLHSGEYGGVAPNAAQAIAELVASLHDPDGSIAVEGFGDGIEPPGEEELRLAGESSPTDAEYAADFGCDPVGGETGKTSVRRNSFEPTIEVNGIHSGYAGAGAKTVIPCEAFAKLSMRLVPGQSAKRVFECVTRHLEARCPRGMKLTVEDANAGCTGFRLPLASPVFRLAEHVLSGMDSRGCAFLWDGASIPVVSVLREASGAVPLLVGWGQAEDRIHSPNESYSFAQFDKAREWGRLILGNLA